MNKISVAGLYVGFKCLFQLSNWAPINLKQVKILYISKTYVIMYNYKDETEYCVKLDSDELFLGEREACFYKDPNGTIHYGDES